MPTIETCPLPERALLALYASQGAYTDCFVTTVDDAVDIPRFVEAFYTTALFKTERLILRLAISAPSTDDQAQQLATGALDRFAAWHVEDRAPDQLLMCDVFGNTRSWFMVEPAPAGDLPRTRLYFGSAVTGTALDRPLFRALGGFHVLYSKALLTAARRRIARRVMAAGRSR